MKTKLTLLLFLSIFINCYSQNFAPAGGGEYDGYKNEGSCLSEENRELVIQELKDNENILIANDMLVYDEDRNAPNPLFIFPIRAANGMEYIDMWGISGYMDHDVNYPNQLEDFNCGTTAYDTNSGYNHQGVDLFTWPFGLKLMDNDQVEVIAASDGQIIAKNDGEYDRSCDFNNNVWNAVYVQHSDGSVAWYGHLKNGSVTSKNVGDTVVQGEYLGVVGSSGNSTGPHLHFEVWEDSSYEVLIDPYAGSCNDTITESWWEDQKPYKNPHINALLTHTDVPVFDCPQTEITYEETQFDEGQSIHFAIYMRDQEANSTLYLQLEKPDGSYLYDWFLDLDIHYTASWWRWNFNTLNEPGEWKWIVTYLGQTVTHTINIGTLSVEENEIPNANIFPNPSEDIIEIKAESKITKVIVRDLLGKTIKIEENNLDGITYIDNSNLANGVYLMTLNDDLDRTKTLKLIMN